MLALGEAGRVWLVTREAEGAAELGKADLYCESSFLKSLIGSFL